MNNSKFSLVLRQCRVNSGLTQKQVAEALNVERSTYAYYETGTTHPSGSMIIKLSKIFNIDYKIFMDAVGDTDFDDNDEDASFTTLSDTSWQERERMYTISKSEQNLLISYRVLSNGSKEKIVAMIEELKKEEAEQKANK